MTPSIVTHSIDPIATAETIGGSRRLPLHDFHVAHGAHFQSFAGFAMPSHYALGILGEHRHTRNSAGLFDVSHMGQIRVSVGRDTQAGPEQFLDAALGLESCVCADVCSLSDGRQRYGLLTTPDGGILDDLMFANLDFSLYLVVNASRTSGDLDHLQKKLTGRCNVEWLTDRALLALQGPEACAVLRHFAPPVAAMKFMDVRRIPIGGVDCRVTRSGYTGEDGFEISMPSQDALVVADLLTSHPLVKLIGLGARDVLRLEAGLCLFGQDIDETTSPVEAGLQWSIGSARRLTGARAGRFPGADLIFSQLTVGASRVRVGLKSARTPIRAGTALFADETAQVAIGRVTSGTYGPSLQAPVAMGYVPRGVAHAESRLYAEVRGQRTPVAISTMPFFPHRYHR